MPQLPILEDYELALRVRRLGNIVTLRDPGDEAAAAAAAEGGGGGVEGVHAPQLASSAAALRNCSARGTSSSRAHSSRKSSSSSTARSSGPFIKAACSPRLAPVSVHSQAPPHRAGTSARRFAANGLWRQCLSNQLALAAYSTGLASPEEIGKWY